MAPRCSSATPTSRSPRTRRNSRSLTRAESNAPKIRSGVRIQQSVYYLHASQVVVRMKQVPTHKPVTAAPSRRAISMHTGHYRLANAALLRVDVELGRFVGRLYTPDMHVKARVHGGEAEVHAWVD